MTSNSKNNLVTYSILIAACLTVALIRAALPDVFVNGPPAWQLFLSFRGTVVTGLLGVIGLVFLNRSGLRGMWDDNLSARQKLLIPLVVGVLLGLVNISLRRFIPIDAAIATFAKSQGVTISPTLAGAILGYFSGAILINIVYFLILIPPVVYFVSGRLLRGRRQGLVYWSIALPLALWEPLTNPPLPFSLEAFGVLGTIVIMAAGTVFTVGQVWFMRRSGFVALVSVRLGLYAITHVLYPRLL